MPSLTTWRVFFLLNVKAAFASLPGRRTGVQQQASSCPIPFHWASENKEEDPLLCQYPKKRANFLGKGYNVQADLAWLRTTDAADASFTSGTQKVVIDSRVKGLLYKCICRPERKIIYFDLQCKERPAPSMAREQPRLISYLALGIYDCSLYAEMQSSVSLVS